MIARRHLIPKQIEAHGLPETKITVADSAIDKVLREYTREAGVRNLERNFATLMRKAARKIAGKAEVPAIEMDADFVSEALGAPPHLPETAERTTLPGVVVGLAHTSHGGEIMFVEATVIPGGDGVRLRLTGQLGDVMRESAEAAQGDIGRFVWCHIKIAEQDGIARPWRGIFCLAPVFMLTRQDAAVAARFGLKFA